MRSVHVVGVAPSGREGSMRRRHRARRGVSMVEFALAAPLGLLLLMGTVITAIVVANQVSLSNLVRDTARAAAVCGGASRDSTTRLPDGTSCSLANLKAYGTARLGSLVGGGGTTLSVNVLTRSGTTVADNLDACAKGDSVQVTVTYAQPLYIPLVGYWLGTPPSTTTRTLSADAEATCEQ